MKNAIMQLEEQERIRFLSGSCIRANIAVLSEIMSASGIASVQMRAHSANRRCLISPDADWVYTRDPDAVAWPFVKLRSVDDAGNETVAEKPLRAAISQVFGDMIEHGHPDWRDGTSSISMQLEGGKALLKATVSTPEGHDRKVQAYRRQPIDLFLEKEPVAETDTGAWYKIETQAEAVAAGDLSQTAVADFYPAQINTGHVHWFAHLEMGETDPVAGVVLAAQSLDDFDLNRWPAASHITGFRNECPYPARAADISTLAEAAGLHIEPNWMGRDLKDGFEAKILVTYISDTISLKDLEAWRKTPNLRELAEEIIEGEPQGVFDVVSVEQIPVAELTSRRAALNDCAPLLDGPLIPQAKTESAGRILRSQMEQGWSNETLEMLGRRFIEEIGMSSAFAAYLEQQAAAENEAALESGDEPGF
ncbi:hypothetical protein AB9K35_17845 [Leisingera sp. XS_AS12]|uniref:hypothetical protein n=1 Tax=Leisingera sp. XS_AS12 TaxID=3241294 RepID=UPI0035172483